jgi:hypothetical protein
MIRGEREGRRGGRKVSEKSGPATKKALECSGIQVVKRCERVEVG